MKTLVYFKFLFLSYLILNYTSSDAQLSANAGEDLILCNFYEEAFVIGGSPTAIGGIEPYAYTWSGKFINDSTAHSIINASEILDDTTLSNPTISLWDVPQDFYTLIVKVEDSIGNIALDSINIVEASIPFHAIYISPDTIFRGDSIQLIGDPYFDSYFTPLSYSISPSYSLVDSTDIFSWAKPDTSTTYYLQAKNSVGCISENIYYWHIEVIDTITSYAENINNLNGNFKFYPNPANKQITIENPNNLRIKAIEIIDFTGRTIQSWYELSNPKNVLQIISVQSGIYLLRFETGSGIETKKIMINR